MITEALKIPLEYDLRAVDLASRIPSEFKPVRNDDWNIRNLTAYPHWFCEHQRGICFVTRLQW